MHTLLVFGAGYTGLQIARQFDGDVFGTTRNRAEELRANGIAPLNIDDTMAIEDVIKISDFIVLSAPPPDPAFQRYVDDIAASSAAVAYLSTTGVYGDRQGDRVDETSALNPTTQRGKARVIAENKWRKAVPNVNIYRLGGIYGPERNPLQKILDGRARKIVKPGQKFSRVHVSDIARVVLASFHQGDIGETYNLVDNETAPPQDVLDYASALIGHEPLEPMDFDGVDLSPMTRSFYSENKIVDNTKIRERFGRMLYPTYREGLSAIWDDMLKTGNAK